MSAMSRRTPRFLLALIVAAALSGAAPALGQTLDPNAIVNALTPKAKPKPMTFRSLFTRGVEVTPEAASEPAPEIDLAVNFDFDSANLTNDGALTLAALGKALMDPRLSGLRFRIIGHTDARGTPAYNQRLSEERAATVGAFLYQFYQIDRSRLELSGRGSSELRDAAHPLDGINRRVQVATIVATEGGSEPPIQARVPDQGPTVAVLPSPKPAIETPAPNQGPSVFVPTPAPSLLVRPASFADLPIRPATPDWPGLPMRPTPTAHADQCGTGAQNSEEDDLDFIAERTGVADHGKIEKGAEAAVRASGLATLNRLRTLETDAVAWTLAAACRDLPKVSPGGEKLNADALDQLLAKAANEVYEETRTIDAAVGLAKEGAQWDEAVRALPDAANDPTLARDDGGTVLSELAKAPHSILSEFEARIPAGPSQARLEYALRRELLKCLAYVMTGPDPTSAASAKTTPAATRFVSLADVDRVADDDCRGRLESVLRELAPGEPPAAPTPAMARAAEATPPPADAAPPAVPGRTSEARTP
jgi:outer membrane protein OmpA-like peptidoglycan-associated protein